MSAKINLATAIAAVLIIGAALTPSASAAPSDEACSLLTSAQVSASVSVSVGPVHLECDQRCHDERR